MYTGTLNYGDLCQRKTVFEQTETNSNNNAICSPLPGNRTLISKYLARRGVVVSGGWSNGSGWQQTTTTIYIYVYYYVCVYIYIYIYMLSDACTILVCFKEVSICDRLVHCWMKP